MILEQAKKVGAVFRDGQLLQDGRVVPCPEEKAVIPGPGAGLDSAALPERGSGAEISMKVKAMVEEEKEIAVDEVEQPDIFQLREIKTMDVDLLAADIERQGLISAVVVRPARIGGTTGFRYQLIVGHRRLAAVQKLKRKSIRARVVDKTDEQGLVMALAENLERKDMTPMEEARAIEKMHGAGMKEKDVAKQLGKSTAWVSQRLAILKVIPEVQKALEKGEITAATSRRGSPD